MNRNEVNQIYRNILLENDEKDKDLSKNYKKHLKHLLQDNLSNIAVVKSMNKTQNEALANFNTAADENDEKSLWKLSKQIREEILAQNWEFCGSLKLYKLPQLLSTFLKWVLIGPHSYDRGTNI